MLAKLQQHRTKLEQLKGKRAKVVEDIALLKTEIDQSETSLKEHEQAREIIKEVGLKTQSQLQVYISDIATLALNAVFDDPYELKVEFVQRRNKTECDIYFVRDGNRIDPLTASGGGAVDIASFALRIASWSMTTPHTRNTIVLDEPLRFLSAGLQERASTMLKEISEKLGIQFILISHNETLASFADKTFEVKLKKGISQIN
jgi:DNA repair exonuclease SbcCD ATPase subunit